MFNSLMNQSMKLMVRGAMKKYLSFPSEQTALLLVDVQGSFLNENAAGTLAIESVAQRNGFRDNLKDLIVLARQLNWLVVYAPYNITMSTGFKSPAQEKLSNLVVDEEQITGTDWIPGKDDLMVANRFGLSAFSGTELDQQLSDLGIEHLVCAGPLVNIGLDSTVRDAVEFGYHTTVITDAVAAFTETELSAALSLTLPRVMHNLLDLAELKKRVG